MSEHLLSGTFSSKLQTESEQQFPPPVPRLSAQISQDKLLGGSFIVSMLLTKMFSNMIV